MNQTITPQRDIFSVSRLVRESRAVLEGSFPLLWVEGEISNLSRPASGHLYFTLKDEAAQVRCAMFRMQGLRLRFQPANGQQVLLRVRVSLYEARGEFQLIAEHMEPAGEGALRLAFERLKAKLAAEGLFDATHKQLLPRLPQQIGLITSPSGAAVRDLLSVLRRRFPLVPVIIYPVAVQGVEAPEQIISALQLANARQECDLLILSRGGGSLEDLQAFNDEGVARALFTSRIPVISGVGHEIDFTIADFVADARAPTPSAAAELAVPDREEWRQLLLQLHNRLVQRICGRLREPQVKTAHLTSRLLRQHPTQVLTQQNLRLQEFTRRLSQAEGLCRLHLHTRLGQLFARLERRSPATRLAGLQLKKDYLRERLQRAVVHRLERLRERLAQCARDLHNLSPLDVLQRGYAIVARSADGQILRSAAEVRPGDLTQVRLSHGSLSCEVKAVTGE